MRPAVARQLLRQRREVGTAQAIAAGGHHHAARQHGRCARRRLQLQRHDAIGARLHRQHAVFVADIERHDATEPAQVLHPLQARDLVQRFPGVQPELGLEPGAEGQRREAQRRAGQGLGGTQGFHARSGGQGPSKSLGDWS
jgi:hypothetical protein